MDSTLRVRRLALLAVVATFLVADIGLAREIFEVQPLGIDFAPIWSGVRIALERPGEMYDFAAVTRDQDWLLGAFGKVRPFVYPPSSAPIFLPFALMGFWVAYPAFMLTTGGLLLWSTWRLSHRVTALLLVLMLPPVWWSVLVGQVTFLVGGLVLMALSLRSRPILAGVLLGVAAAVKPQLLVLFPLALALEGRWRMLAAATGAGGALCVLSLAMLGVGPWLDWLAALPRFSALIGDDRLLLAGVITPTGALVRLGVAGPALVAAQVLFWAAGPAVVWWAFTRATSPLQRLAALVGGSLLLAPYAMGYEFAILAPAAAVPAANLEVPRWPIHLVALLLLNLALPGAVALIGLLILVLQPWRPVEPEAAAAPVSVTT